MSFSNPFENDFVDRLTSITNANLKNPQFGVSRLAKEMGMSRSNLHRKVNATLKISVSQFINQVRLKKAKEILRHSSETVSEVAYRVGFNSVSYFIKCFHEYFGYSPGEVGNREENQNNSNFNNQNKSGRMKLQYIVGIAIVLAALTTYFYFNPLFADQKDAKKSIAVLLPVNNSTDTTSHIIEGIIQTVHNNLALIKDLRVIPTTSVRKYRHEEKTIPEIAKELNVNFIVESSGHVIENKIRLTISLIHTTSHNTIWSEQYTDDIQDIFNLEDKISKEISKEIDAQITPEEQLRIEKKPTENKTAYNYYLLGNEILNKSKLIRSADEEDYYNAIKQFEKAVEHDPEFALAYAEIARVYYYLDVLPNQKQFTEQIRENAERAVFFDPDLEMSNIAKALYYITQRDFEWAINYLEKALKINPNSFLATFNLRQIFSIFRLPDSGKQLKYSLIVSQLANNFTDSTELSFVYTSLATAFRNTAVFEKAEEYFNKSLEINPDNFLASCEKSLMYQDMEKDFQQQIEVILPQYQKDSTDYYVLRSMFLLHFENREYEKALYYHAKRLKYNVFGNKRDAAKVGFILLELGENKQAQEYFNIAIENDKTIPTFYKLYYSSSTYAAMRDTTKAIESIKSFSKYNNYNYWALRAYKTSPIFKYIRNLPEFKKIILEMENQFRINQKEIIKSLEKEDLL